MSNIFPNIYGNEKIKALLGAHIADSSESHAYIIEGPAGSGKSLIANAAAQAMLCTGKGDTLPCNMCPACKKFLQGLSPDVLFLDKGDKQTIQVDSVRDFLSSMCYAPSDGDKKIYIIDEADKMTPQAQNALLLSLEEPPAYVRFILIAQDSLSLLPTIRSRAPVLQTQLFSPERIADWLSNELNISYSDSSLKTAAAAAGGSLGRSLRIYNGLADKKGGESADPAVVLCKEADAFVQALCSGVRSKAVTLVSKMKHSRQDQGQLLNYAMEAVRDAICVKASDTSPLIHFTDRNDAAELSRKSTIARLYALYDKISSAKEDIVSRNASDSAVLMSLALWE